MSFANTTAAPAESASGFAGVAAFNSYTLGLSLVAAITLFQYLQARKYDVRLYSFFGF